MAEPVATVIIPTYNQRPDWLNTAIQSALGQTVPVEILVVDDGSTDPVLVEEPVRVLRHKKNKGIAAALNTGIGEASTEWICWLSSDDTIKENKVEKQVLALKLFALKASFHRYEVQFVDGVAYTDSGFPNRMHLWKSEVWTWPSLEAQMSDFMEGCYVNGSTSMIHRSVFEQVGLFDETFRFGQDYEMWCRIGQSYKWLFLSEVLGVRREMDNLTQRIRRTPDLQELAAFEDGRIRRMYGNAGH